MINNTSYLNFRQLFFLLCIPVFLCACQPGKSTSQETESIMLSEWVEKIITRNELSTLEFIQPDFLQDFSFESIHGSHENGEVGYYPIVGLRDKKLGLIRRKISGTTIFYLCVIKDAEKASIEKVVDISSRMFFLQGQRGNSLVYIRFTRPENPTPENEGYDIEVCTETQSNYYERNVESYFFTYQNNLTLKSKQSRKYKEENEPAHSYEDFLENGKPDCLFTTYTMLDELEYMDIAGLFNRFSITYYRCDTSTDIGFYVLPTYYKNHNLVIERIREKDNYKFLLRKINNEAPGFENEPILDMTPHRKELNKEIRTYIECYEGNILLIFTEEKERGLTSNSICSLIPSSTEKLEGEYKKTEDMFMWLADDTAFYREKQEEHFVKDFLAYYCANYDSSFNTIRLVDTISEKESSYYQFKIDEQGCQLFMDRLEKSGYFSGSYLSKLETYFKGLAEYYEQNPKLDVPEGLEHDLILLSLNPDNIRQIIERKDYTTLFVRPIHENRSIVAIHLGEHALVYDLYKDYLHTKKWQITDFDVYFPFDKFYANGSSGSLIVPKNEEQLEKYFTYKGLEREDKDYCLPIKNGIHLLEQYHLTATMLDTQYNTIVLPDNTEISMNGLYLYDAIIYTEKEHVILRGIEENNKIISNGIDSLLFTEKGKVSFDFSM